MLKSIIRKLFGKGRVSHGDCYYYVSKKFKVIRTIEHGNKQDQKHYETNNYFTSEAEAISSVKPERNHFGTFYYIKDGFVLSDVDTVTEHYDELFASGNYYNHRTLATCKYRTLAIGKLRNGLAAERRSNI